MMDKELKDIVWAHADELRLGLKAEDYDLDGDDEPTVSDWFEGVLDINWICHQDKSFRGAELLVAFGGPNIYINTVTKTVEGSWGGSSEVASYQDSIGLEDFCEELFEN